MAILIVEHNGTVEGASLGGRILIGRRPSNHVVVDDPAVSRIHAWIDTADRRFTVTDAGSRTGTFVNGQRVAGKLALRHGDRITVGPASLTFRADASLPAGVSQLDFRGRERDLDAAAAADGGILFDCTCGAPLWIASAHAGRLGKCRYCGTVLRVPNRPGVVGTEEFVAAPRDAADAPAVATLAPPPAAPAIPAPARQAARPPTGTARSAAPAVAPAVSPGAAPAQSPTSACGVCQSAIEAGESSTTCPACGLTFHLDCWTENFGCSAYGCSMVDALLPTADPAAPDVSDETRPAPPHPLADSRERGAPDADLADIPAPRIPPEHALLAGAVAGALLGALTFGVPALLALAATLVYLKRHPDRRQSTRKIALAAAVLAAAGVVAGVAVSYVWWLGGSPAGAESGIGVWSGPS